MNENFNLDKLCDRNMSISGAMVCFDEFIVVVEESQWLFCLVCYGGGQLTNQLLYVILIDLF